MVRGKSHSLIIIPVMLVIVVILTWFVASKMYMGSSASVGGTTIGNKPIYNEKAILVFPSSSANDSLGQSLVFTVNAVAQTDEYGFGPAYLVNGLTNTGYWYQVGMAYNWPVGALGVASSYLPGFSFVYEVFDPSGVPVYPSMPFSYIASISMRPVYDGDSITISLVFDGSNNVIMRAIDTTTGAVSQQSYTAYGATRFVSTTTPKFFTGLMEEWYHANPNPVLPKTSVTFTTTSKFVWVSGVSSEVNSDTGNFVYYNQMNNGMPIYLSDVQQLYYIAGIFTLTATSTSFKFQLSG